LGKVLTLYHGSEKIIMNPVFGEGKLTNDFGLGFYCTGNEALSKEWAVNSLRDGFSNKYELNIEYMKVLNLNTPDYSVLKWIAILLQFRSFSIKNAIARKAKAYIIDNFGINVNSYDIIIGYRADDSYFDYAESFINNTITVTQLAKAMRLGNLGEQVVLKSKFAFETLVYKGFSVAERDKYFVLRKSRDEEANKMYQKITEDDDDGLYINEIMKAGIQNDDKSIPRNVSE